MASANAEAGLKLATPPVAVVAVVVVVVVVVCQHIGQPGEWAEAAERAGRYGKVAHSYTQKMNNRTTYKQRGGETCGTKWLMLVYL